MYHTLLHRAIRKQRSGEIPDVGMTNGVACMYQDCQVGTEQSSRGRRVPCLLRLPHLRNIAAPLFEWDTGWDERGSVKTKLKAVCGCCDWRGRSLHSLRGMKNGATHWKHRILGRLKSYGSVSNGYGQSEKCRLGVLYPVPEWRGGRMIASRCE